MVTKNIFKFKSEESFLDLLIFLVVTKYQEEVDISKIIIDEVGCICLDNCDTYRPLHVRFADGILTNVRDAAGSGADLSPLTHESEVLQKFFGDEKSYLVCIDGILYNFIVSDRYYLTPI